MIYLAKYKIYSNFNSKARVVLYKGDAGKFLTTIPEKTVNLIVTSPPYNIGKEYERAISIEEYREQQSDIIEKCVRTLSDSGSICWQVGNYISDDLQVVPLDILLYDIFIKNGLVLRNRIVWHFGHGLHAKKRFSGRYETIMWFTKKDHEYYFDLNAIRVPQKYPGKRHYKGEKKGEYSGNPNGKNPGDFWEGDPDYVTDIWEIPNVKANHIEKTEHPCQFPIGLVQRLIRSMTKEGDWVLDPFLGTGSTACAALIENRRALGSEIMEKYVDLSRKRINATMDQKLNYRPLDKPIYEPKKGSKLTIRADDNENH